MLPVHIHGVADISSKFAGFIHYTEKCVPRSESVRAASHASAIRTTINLNIAIAFQAVVNRYCGRAENASRPAKPAPIVVAL